MTELWQLPEDPFDPDDWYSLGFIDNANLDLSIDTSDWAIPHPAYDAWRQAMEVALGNVSDEVLIAWGHPVPLRS